jgi:cytoskeletal protein RodZ
MFNVIEDLREKGDNTKKRIAFLLALLFSGIIFVIWLTVIYPNFVNQKKEESALNENKEGPVTNFTDTISRGIFSIEKQIQGLKESTGELFNSTHFSNGGAQN